MQFQTFLLFFYFWKLYSSKNYPSSCTLGLRLISQVLVRCTHWPWICVIYLKTKIKILIKDWWIVEQKTIQNKHNWWIWKKKCNFLQIWFFTFFRFMKNGKIRIIKNVKIWSNEHKFSSQHSKYFFLGPLHHAFVIEANAHRVIIFILRGARLSTTSIHQPTTLPSWKV